MRIVKLHPKDKGRLITGCDVLIGELIQDLMYKRLDDVPPVKGFGQLLYDSNNKISKKIEDLKIMLDK